MQGTIIKWNWWSNHRRLQSHIHTSSMAIFLRFLRYSVTRAPSFALAIPLNEANSISIWPKISSASSISLLSWFWSSFRGSGINILWCTRYRRGQRCNFLGNRLKKTLVLLLIRFKNVHSIKGWFWVSVVGILRSTIKNWFMPIFFVPQ